MQRSCVVSLVVLEWSFLDMYLSPRFPSSILLRLRSIFYAEHPDTSLGNTSP
jgi:hypothetical protein